MVAGFTEACEWRQGRQTENLRGRGGDFIQSGIHHKTPASRAIVRVMEKSRLNGSVRSVVVGTYNK
ncbi:hypothetical protein BK660_17575 [Pseudomonas brassicacearum]|uniref:Uncharacterized protein n=1 Tax=Pseudomonas brassicacearum TaxID=930166 RepID=A0A423I610_9PSED|nr:hypothetical protein BK660_17575 [Pseudomonas brassicacearum]